MNVKKKFLPVSNDLMFKNLFGVQDNVDFTCDLLEKLLGYDSGTLKDLVVSNSIKLNKEVITNKLFEMDVLITLESGHHIVLEMQNIYDKDAQIKNIIYICGTFYKSLKSGDEYKNVKGVSGITFVSDIKIKHHKKDKLIEKYYLSNGKNKMIPELFNMMLVKLEHNCEYYKEVPSRFVSWMKFLSAKTKEELEEASKSDPILMKAYKECVRFMELDYVQNFDLDEMLRRNREMRHIDEASKKSLAKGISQGISQGISRGISQGALQKQQEIAKSMIQEGMQNDVIQRITKLSIKEIEILKKEINK